MSAPGRVSPRDGVAWVTGASEGIGRALAIGLARAGWRVAATARGAEALASLAGEHSAIRSYPADVTDRVVMADTFSKIVENEGPIALAVLNAGIYLPVDACAPDVRAFEQSLSTNVMGVVHALSPVTPHMIIAGRGHIVIMGSATGYGGLPTAAAYGATKAALNNLAETLSIELHRHGLRVSIVNPGFVDTQATRANTFAMPFLMSPQDAAQHILRGLGTGAFEIAFPRRFIAMFKVLRLLPAGVRLWIIRRATKWT